MKYYNLSNSIVVSFDNEVHTISKDDYRYSRIKDAISRQDFDSIKVAIDPTDAAIRSCESIALR